ncbi:Colicin V production protein [Candidatus Erwinia haradaeae]|uniref:Colicin V production protein n=1 Tax=Candidatus Erwinia haradaeae TaxID=1922217 RepID=A0A451DCJ2_9GAMM|nr:CvpA family protein [Candidatus Erwinia haradaeae]VFP84144.1 Colicin V production protein [Candidatus Erwinia haradaeae]
MIWIDYLIVAIIGFSILVSSTRGLIKEILSLITWSMACFVAYHYYGFFSTFLEAKGLGNQLVCNGISIIFLFIGSLLIGVFITSMMESLVVKTGLKGTDQVLGVCFGGLRGIFIVAAMLFFFDTFTDVSTLPDLHKSQLAPRFSYLINWIVHHLNSTSNFLLL